MHKPVTNKKELAWYELCMQNQTQQIKFEKLMEINFALEKMYPQNTYIRLIRSSGMGNCLFLHAWGWWVDHQEQKTIANPEGYACGGMVTGQIYEPTIKYEVIILGLQSRERAALLKVKITRTAQQGEKWEGWQLKIIFS